MSRKHSIAVLIPCYNEANTVGKVIDDFRAALPDATIYVYDNNSTDSTDKVALKHGATVTYEYRQGKGNVMRSMFRDIDADAYLMIDGDDTYPAENAREMVDMILNRRADMVIGDRLSSTYFTENKRAGHSFGNKLVRKLINLAFKANVRDVMTGYRAYSYEFVKSFPVLSKGFEIETEMTIHALDKNFSIQEILVHYRDRQSGSESKLNTIPDGLRVLRTIFNLAREYKPMLFFGIFALISLLIGVVCLLVPLDEYLRTGFVGKFPTLMIGVLFTLVALLLYITGLITDSLAKKHRQLFEINLNILNKK